MVPPPAPAATFYARAAMPARLLVERADWQGAAKLPVPPSGQPYGAEALSLFARAIGAARSGDATQAAQDAEFTVDGIAYTRPANSITDVFAGITVTLKKAAPGVPVAVTTGRPTELIRQTMTDFISVYNTLKKDVIAARSSTGGDPALRALEAQITALISNTVTSDPDINSLTDIGVFTNRDGSITLDSAKFNAALAAKPDAVEALFSPTRDATHDAITDPGLSGALQSLKDTATASGGALASVKTRLDKETQQIADARKRMESREAAYMTRLQRQFVGMDARVAALKATQSYLDQQIKSWNRS